MDTLKNGKSITIKLSEDLTSTKNISFETEVISLINENALKEVIIDLDEVKMVDSFGIRGLFAVHKNLVQTDGELKVINVSKDIFGLFKYMRMDTHFEITGK